MTYLTDKQGNLVEQYRYDAFGKPIFLDDQGSVLASSAYANRFLFTGREWLQEIALYDYRRRIYSPELGRWLQTDPIGFSAGDVNIYRYCTNDPVNRRDPSGLMPDVEAANNYSSDNTVGEIYREVDRMRRKGHHDYPFEKNSAMRHCVISCQVAQKYGVEVARLAGIGNEAQGFLIQDIPNMGTRRPWGNSPWAFQPSDLADNERGFHCANRVGHGCCKSCEECCSGKCK